jgi:PhzF family phenazine biosynthesis protein
MQDVAAEMNLSETAFVRPLSSNGTYELRWFTPTIEVELCGHATLAAAHVLWEQQGLADATRIRFETAGGVLSALRRDGQIELDFPSAPPTQPISDDEREDLEAALRSTFIQASRNKLGDVLVELDSEETVRSLAPDFRRLEAILARVVIVTSLSRSRSEFDFVSRSFAPRAGIPEDPVTGSAHCALGPFWGARLNRAELTGYQASRRGGYVGVRLEGERIALIGQAVTVLRGEFV